MILELVCILNLADHPGEVLLGCLYSGRFAVEWCELVLIKSDSGVNLVSP
jgi:hypothetical protein